MNLFPGWKPFTEHFTWLQQFLTFREFNFLAIIQVDTIDWKGKLLILQKESV